MSFFGKYYFTAAKHLAGECDEAAVREMLGEHAHSAEGVPNAWLPSTDLYETEEGVVVLMDVPGVCPENLRVEVSSSSVAVRGVRCEKQARCKRAYRVLEIHHGPFERTLALPRPVAAEASRACLHDGVLELNLTYAKPAAVKTGAVLIQVAWEMAEHSGG